jgi:signal transduction histidine kinase
MKKIKEFEFIKSISESIEDSYSPNDFLNLLHKIIQNFMPFKRIITFYRDGFGNKFRPFPEKIDNSQIIILNENSNLIKSFITRKSSILFEKKENIYWELFNKDSNNLLDKYNINYIIPLYCKNYYRGILLANIEHNKTKLIKDIDRIIKIAANIFIPIIETERLENENDRNYYRLFKFDRLVLLGEMVASISHELKTPMNTIILEIEEIIDSYIKPDEIKSALKKIKKETLRVNNFIESLLSFSKLKEISIIDFSLKEFIEKALNDIPKKRIPANVKIIKEIDEDLYVSADKNRLHQVFLNILFNAVDAVGETGEITIRIYSEYKEVKKGMKYIISINDNGPGIPLDIKDKVLKPFFTTKKEGTGLGLYISYGIMKSLKGDLEIESTENGTTVYLILQDD